MRGPTIRVAREHRADGLGPEYEGGKKARPRKPWDLDDRAMSNRVLRTIYMPNPKVRRTTPCPQYSSSSIYKRNRETEADPMSPSHLRLIWLPLSHPPASHLCTRVQADELLLEIDRLRERLESEEGVRREKVRDLCSSV